MLMRPDTPESFPADTALLAMGNTSRRWQNHFDTGKIYAPDGVILTASHGPGRGKLRRFPIQTIVQGRIAFSLIDAGVDVREAYKVGAKFAYLGDINGAFSYDENAPLDPVLDRLPCRVFAQGETYLIYAVGEIQAHEDRFAVISDAHPQFSHSSDLSPPAAIINAVGGEDDAAKVVLNLSELCRKIASSLSISFTAAFVTEVE